MLENKFKQFKNQRISDAKENIMTKLKMAVWRLDHTNKTISIAQRCNDNSKNLGFKIVEKDGQEFASWNHMRRINRPDLDMWPVLWKYVPEKDSDFYIQLLIRQYENMGYKYLQVKFYEDNY